MLDQHGIDPGRPTVVYVGRVTRQKGLPVLLRAAELLEPDVQIVLCAGQADTAELGAEVTGLVGHLRDSRSGVVWLDGMLPKREVIQILSHATVFACPSLYEPLGIVNLEAMACGTPVVGSRVGGIPEVVLDAQTGLLVPPGDHVLLAEALTSLLDRSGQGGGHGPARARSTSPRSSAGPASRARPPPCTPSSPGQARCPPPDPRQHIGYNWYGTRKHAKHLISGTIPAHSYPQWIHAGLTGLRGRSAESPVDGEHCIVAEQCFLRVLGSLRYIASRR